jgi:excisionase family DNA binding protein
MQSKEPKLIRIKKAAKQIGVSDQTLRKWVESGIMRCIKLPSGERRFEQDEINRMCEIMRLDDENLCLYRKLKDALWQEGVDKINEFSLYKFDLAMKRIEENVKLLTKLSWLDIISEIHTGCLNNRNEIVKIKWGDLDIYRNKILEKIQKDNSSFYNYVLDQVNTEIRNRDRWLVNLGLKVEGDVKRD